jgi:hypothetical protein
LQAQTVRDGAALKCPLPTSSALGYGNRKRHFTYDT